jgi:hypothetical protein
MVAMPMAEHVSTLPLLNPQDSGEADGGRKHYRTLQAEVVIEPRSTSFRA